MLLDYWYNSVLISLVDNGVLVWTPLNIQPVLFTVQVSDHMSSSLLVPILQLCNCLNGGTCQYQSVTENYLQGKFQVTRLHSVDESIMTHMSLTYMLQFILFLMFYIPRLLGVCAQQVLVEDTVEIELMHVKASLAFLEWTVSVRERGTALAVDSVLPLLSLMAKKVTSALRMVSIIHHSLQDTIHIKTVLMVLN